VVRTLAGFAIDLHLLHVSCDEYGGRSGPGFAGGRHSRVNAHQKLSLKEPRLVFACSHIAHDMHGTVVSVRNAAPEEHGEDSPLGERSLASSCITSCTERPSIAWMTEERSSSLSSSSSSSSSSAVDYKSRSVMYTHSMCMGEEHTLVARVIARLLIFVLCKKGYACWNQRSAHAHMLGSL
jgi:hypothetical protein